MVMGERLPSAGPGLCLAGIHGEQRGRPALQTGPLSSRSPAGGRAEPASPSHTLNGPQLHRGWKLALLSSAVLVSGPDTAPLIRVAPGTPGPVHNHRNQSARAGSTSPEQVLWLPTLTPHPPAADRPTPWHQPSSIRRGEYE